MNRFDAVARVLDMWAGLAGFVALLVMGEWWLVLVGFLLMAVGSGLIAALLIPVERVFVALSTGLVPITFGLGSRRPTLLYYGALIYAGAVFALWCSGVLSYFAGQAEGGARLAALVWSVSVAMAPVRAKDRFTPGLLPMYSSVVRGGYLTMVVAAAVVELRFPTVLAAFALIMVGAGFAHQRWSKWIGAQVLDSVAPAETGDGDESVPTVTLFPTSSAKGRALADAFENSLRDRGYRVKVLRDATQDQVEAACAGSGAVIFDATREPDDDANYRTVLYALITDYVIPVSRNYLPANFPHLIPIAPPYPDTVTNESLVAAACERLGEMRDLLPRKSEHRGWRNQEALIDHALESAMARRRREYNVFVSYRGLHEPAVARFAERHEGGESGHRIRFFSASELAIDDEILSLQRRWHVLRLIERSIRAATEVWVYDTEDYLASWWTRAELILLSRMDPANRPTLKVYDPAADRFHEPSVLLTPEPDDRQMKIMDRLLFFALQPEWSGRVREDMGDSLFASMLRGREDVFDPSFVDDPLLQCGTCTAAIQSAAGIDVGEFIECRYPALHRIPQRHIEAAVAGGRKLPCPGCGAGHTVSTAPPRYWWYPERNGIGTGPGGGVLETRPTYRASG